jgi:hypothetical protein
MIINPHRKKQIPEFVDQDRPARHEFLDITGKVADRKKL